MFQNFGAFTVPAAAGGGGGGFASDNFTDTTGTNLESHVPSGGGTWTAVGTPGGCKIDTNHVYNSVSGDWFGYYMSPSPADADYSVTMTIHANSGTDTVMGPAGRLATANTAGYFVKWDGGGSAWYLNRFDGSGGETNIGSYAGDSPATADRTVKLSMSGTTIAVYVGGISRISVTDSTYASAGKCGFDVFYFTNNSTSWGDDMTCDDTP